MSEFKAIEWVAGKVLMIDQTSAQLHMSVDNCIAMPQLWSIVASFAQLSTRIPWEEVYLKLDDFGKVAQVMVEDIASALSWENAIELGEAPDVLAANSEFLAKIAAPQGKIVDGHGQGLDMKHLNAYIDCSIVSDHKSTSLEPAKEKLKYHRITGSEA